MSKLREAAAAALEAWTNEDGTLGFRMESLRAALAEPVQEAAAHKQAAGSKNCMQVAVAHMLGLPVEAVTDFETRGAAAWESMEGFFEARGFTVEMLPPNIEILGDYLASGTTARGTSHMVVMRGGKLLHDPHPSNAGLQSIQAVWLVARKAGPQRQEQDEPVAVVELMKTGGNAGLATRIVEIDDHLRERLRPGTKLYTHPAPQRQPLTTEQIAALESRRHRNLPPDFDYTEGAWFELGIRHGERAHGIGGDE